MKCEQKCLLKMYLQYYQFDLFMLEIVFILGILLKRQIETCG